MLCGETGPLARKLAQAFGVNAVGATRIEADRAQSSPLFHQARKSAMTGRTGWLTRPGQMADRGAFFCRQESVQRLDLHGKQPSGQLVGDLALGKRRCRRDQPLDDGRARCNSLPPPQLVQQCRGDRDGVGVSESDRHQPGKQLAAILRCKHSKIEYRPQRAQLLATRLVAYGIIGKGVGGDARWPATKAIAASGMISCGRNRRPGSRKAHSCSAKPSRFGSLRRRSIAARSGVLRVQCRISSGSAMGKASNCSSCSRLTDRRLGMVNVPNRV